jgi:4-hydroxy-3-methylbut-2-enyl diphosphate reductase
VVQEARERGLTVFDATCPLVTKVHVEVVRFARQGFDCIVIGHFGHPEVEGTLGQFDTRWGGRVHVVESVADVAGLTVQDPAKVGYVTQTTLSVDDTAAVIDALRLRFPEVHGPRRDDICYATQNRQDAVRELASRSDVVLVVGSANSSNSNRLREIAERLGVPAHLIDGADDIHAAWLDGAGTVGVTAGASAPEASVAEVLERLRVLGATQVDELPGDRESVHFPLPAKLRVLARG